MRAKRLITVFLVCLTAHSSALTPEGVKAGEELTATLTAEMKALGADPENRNAVMAIRQYLRQVQAALGQENGRQLSQLLDNFGEYEPSEKVTECLKNLNASMEQAAKTKSQAIISELETTLAAAAEAVARAEEPEDLDKIIASLTRGNRYNDDGESYNNPTIRSLMSDISSARQFVTAWQDYLQASDSGDTAQATQALKNLAGQERTLIPRSQIIARLEFERADDDEVSKVTDQVKKLADMKEAIRKLNRMAVGNRNSSSDNPGPRETLQTLIKLEKTYREYLAGLPVSPDVLQTSSDSTERAPSFDSSALRAELLVLVLPRALDLPAEFQPVQGETVDALLKRATDDANRRDDAATALRVGTLRQTLAKSSRIAGSELEAARDYTAGLKQLEAKQYLLAVVSLQKALKSGSDFVPAAKAGELLDAICKDHPKEFEQGMMEFLTPRATPEQDFSHMPYRNFVPPGMRYRDGDPRAQGGTTIVLPVPGAPGPKDQPQPPAPGNRPPGRPAPESKE